jgi:hypothetical protein
LGTVTGRLEQPPAVWGVSSRTRRRELLGPVVAFVSAQFGDPW